MRTSRQKVRSEYLGYTFTQVCEPKEAADLVKYGICKILECKTRIFINYYEDPIDDHIPGSWRKIKEGHYELLDHTNLLKDNSFLEWLRLGNWTLYSSPKMLENIPIFDFGKSPNNIPIDDFVVMLQAFFDMEFVTSIVKS
jgi:hypothetical protein